MRQASRPFGASVESRAIDSLARVYGAAGRAGLWRLPIAERLFLRGYFAYKRWWEDPLAALARARPGLFAGGDALDVGANVGYTAGVLAAAIDPGRRVWAFEPDAEAAGRLRRRFTGARGERVVLIEAAVGAAPGDAVLRHNPGHPADHRLVPAGASGTAPAGDLRRVDLVSLDGFAAERDLGAVRFVKIDAQGYELQVCRGAGRLLAANPEILVALELAPAAMAEFGDDAGDLWRLLADQGFAAHRLDRDARLPRVSPKDLEPLLAARGYADLLFSRRQLDR